MALGGGLFFFDQHGYVPRPSRLRVGRLQREKDPGFAPSTSDYHFAISFDSDGFTTSCPAFVPKTTEIYCHATTPIGQPERLIRFETIWSNKSLAATQNGRFIAIPQVALIGPTDRSTGR